MQNRAKTGVEFENSVQIDGWVKKTKSPRMKWCGKGSSVFDKIKSVDYDPTRFILNETVDINKYDITNGYILFFIGIKYVIRTELMYNYLHIILIRLS